MKASINIKREQIKDVHIECYSKLNGGNIHFHAPIELLYVRNGSARVWIGHTEAVVRENEMAVVLNYETHRFMSVTDEGDYSIIWISPNMCPEFTEKVRYKNAHNPIVCDSETMESVKRVFDKISAGELNSIEQRGYVYVLLGALLKQIELEDAHDRRDDSLSSKLFFYINEHYKEDISLDIIAQMMGYGRQHLSKCFRSNFQMGINDYINTLRLKNAVLLMRNKSKNITECALESGFGSISTFYRVFADEFGCTPRDYLNRESDK
jgi:AraC-like DNA-binding protein/mannose-6-phosphate isomerase-like protein (cupin superfamily)